MRLTCRYSVGEDGSVEIEPNPSWRSRRPYPFRLNAGPEASLWLAIAELAGAPLEIQRSVLTAAYPSEDDRNQPASLYGALSTFARLGCLQVEDTFTFAARDNEFDTPPLRKLHLEITHRCNFACKACYLGSHLKRPGEETDEATTEQWCALIGTATRLGCEFATVTGGEPFVRRDALAIVRCLSDAGVLTEINTNGSCITPRLAKDLANLRIYSVEVSLYGHSDVNARVYTGNGRSYSTPVRGIQALGEAGVPHSVKYFATGSSYERFEAVQAALRPLGVEPRLVGRFIHGDIYAGDVANARAVTASLPDQLVIQQTDLPCYPSVNALAIEPDGRIRACPKLGIHFGNVFADGLETVWTRSTRLNSFRDFWPLALRKYGYVKGAEREHLCLATEVLSTRGGLQAFRREWEEFAGNDIPSSP